MRANLTLREIRDANSVAHKNGMTIPGYFMLRRCLSAITGGNQRQLRDFLLRVEKDPDSQVCKVLKRDPGFAKWYWQFRSDLDIGAG